jgi:mannosyltransferase OCH1-like enzyme
MIPKIIWQTYEVPFNDLLPEIKECVKTWTSKNSEWEYMYMDAKERNSFVLNNFGNEWYKIFSECKLGVVKANIWRCMVLYTYGGVYCDLDTICNEPIEFWLKDNYSMTLSKDDNGNPEDYCIYVFASEPKSIALKEILNNIKNNIINKDIDKKDVIELTGESVWSNTINKQEKKYNIYCYKKGSNIFDGLAVKHLGTFKKWNKKGYIQWTDGTL